MNGDLSSNCESALSACSFLLTSLYTIHMQMSCPSLYSYPSNLHETLPNLGTNEYNSTFVLLLSTLYVKTEMLTRQHIN